MKIKTKNGKPVIKTAEQVAARAGAASAPTAPPVPTAVKAPPRFTAAERAAMTPEQRKAYRAAKRAARAPWIARTIRAMTRTGKKLERLAGAFSTAGQDETGKALTSAHQWVGVALEAMAKLPAEFRATGARTTGETTWLVPGAEVVFSEKRLPQYQAGLPGVDLSLLRVVTIASPFLSVETVKGNHRLPVRLGDIRQHTSA